ncbi:hypothetical protein WJX72_005984 [[Myrmecia] bisecta]|uniref:PsbP C-terminal domain-containing protein n=1 Tax=[Myrmecia] bisecta TaxID=41462 RepID=A0AAW1Q081_9CHLO
MAANTLHTCIDDLVEFVPNKTKTPSIRAGVIDVNKAYKFALPPSWREVQVANIQSGNFCMPRCDEPWTEVIFTADKEGKLQLIVAPLNRLTRKANASLSDIGPPEGIVESLGNFITGTYLDVDDVVFSEKKQTDGRLYYLYETNASYGTNGPHCLSSVTTKGDLAYLFVVSANDKQWAKSESKLREVVQSFRA